MDPKDTPKSDLAEELESLREEIAHLHSLTLRPSARSAEAPSSATPLPAEILEDAPFGMALVDAAGRLAGCNRALCLMCGYDEGELAPSPSSGSAGSRVSCRGSSPRWPAGWPGR